MSDFDFADLLRAFACPEKKEDVIKKYINGEYSKTEYMEKMTLLDSMERRGYGRL